MNILLTGGTGFLGSNLAKQLIEKDTINQIVVASTDIRQKNSLRSLGLENNPKINLVKGDIRDFDFLRLLFNEYEFSGIFHLAAVSEVRKCQDDAKLAFDVNVGGVINILEISRLFSSNLKFIIVSSSDKAYGKGELPYKEENKLDGRSVYEVSKSCADLVARSYFYNYNLPVVVTRCSNIYGPGDMNLSRVIPNNINKILEGKKPLLWKGSEKSIREYLFIDDAVNAYLSLAKNIDITKGKAYNIGSGKKVTVEDLLKLLLKMMDSKLKIDYKDKNFPEIDNQYLSSDLIKNDIGWESSTSMEEGLEKTIEFFKKILI